MDSSDQTRQSGMIPPGLPEEQERKKAQGVEEGKCTNCGWVLLDPQDPPAYCPECGMSLSSQKDIPDSCSWTTMDPKKYWRL